jgi:hypothetical protein
MTRDIGWPIRLSKIWGGKEVFQTLQQTNRIKDEISQLKREYERILKRVQEWRKRSLGQGDFEVIVRETLARLEAVWIRDNTQIQQEIEKFRREISEK